MSWETASLAPEGAPKWFQIAEILRRSIARGEFSPGDIMPTEARLNETFGISRTTARAALNRLVQDGLLIRRPGVGSVVLAPKVDQPVSQIRGFTEDMLSRGLVPSFTVLECGWETATGEAAHALGLASSDKPFKSVRLLKANDRLIGHSASWIRPDIFGDIPTPTRDILATGSLYSWLRHNIGIEISGGVEFIEAQAADPTTAAQLEIEPGTAVLVITRIAKATSGLPVEFATVIYRSDRYRFRVEL
ncbi:GntR family transcriptional regulator [Pelagibacterium sp. 26DY04]|uniref:GntR family transcriptional regulator n=1 Tax=unclassified Pelagibacterium TaxID=2623280 RepID=UPI002814C657|nr:MULTISPECIES: GntR family transcriptional regulator [unclassified Pelagibacterium]WMT85276.1 GntR family transcriptional regulator [Pelagibacterium sp. 26DY04]WMT90417.1 GntR family transcriptional regulator [Pelagibacterium sp. H642]